MAARDSLERTPERTWGIPRPRTPERTWGIPRPRPESSGHSRHHVVGTVAWARGGGGGATREGPGPVGGPVGPAWLPPSRVVRLHHYYTKSRAELLAKEQPTTPRADFAHVARGSPLPLSCTAAEESVLAALSDARDTTLFDELREWDKALADELQASGLIHMQHGSAAGRMDHRQGCGQKGARIPALPPADLPVATISQLADAVKPASSIFVSHMKAAGRAM